MKKRIGLSLSGGGYRAAAFHLGTLGKLNELNILPKIEVLSTISGGSITGAAYCLKSALYPDFEKAMVGILQSKSVIKSILTSFTFIRLCILVILFASFIIYLASTMSSWLVMPLIIIFIVLVIKYQFVVFPVSKEVERAYNKFFYKDKALNELCEKPEIAIGSTNLQTGRPFTFSKRKIGDSTYAYMKPSITFNGATFPVAKAVTASSCVPFAFTPISIEKQYFINENDAERINPKLVDGGVYDNQGIQKLSQWGSSYECDIIITSDAGNKLPFEGAYNNTIILLIRTVNVFMNRIKNFQMAQNLYQTTQSGNKQIAYLSLGWDLDNCIPEFINNIRNKTVTNEVIKAHGIPDDWIAAPDQFLAELTQLLERITDYNKIKSKSLNAEKVEIARGVGTNLTCLSAMQIEYLMHIAGDLTEMQVKLYCPYLFQ